MHTPEKIWGWRMYRTKLRVIDCDVLDMREEWMSTEYQNVLEMKMSRKRPRSRPQTRWLVQVEREREGRNRTILGEGRGNAGRDR
jgi:hypothetical protein